MILDEIVAVLRDHKLWIESKGKKGKRADFGNRDLREADLSDAELEEASLQKAILQGARLVGANLRNADLSFAVLQGSCLNHASLEQANLYQADLRDSQVWQTNFANANLQQSDLTGAKGLCAAQLRGSDLTGARLRDEECHFDSLKQITDLSHDAQKLLTAVTLVSVYLWVTIGITTDARLIDNSASSPLPLIGAEIPIVGFYWIAPLFVFSLYVWFQLYLQRLWRTFAEMPAYFPDGARVLDKTYSWPLNSLVDAYSVRLRPGRGPFAWFEVLLSKLIAYWLVPITLVPVWARYLPRHDWWGTFLHIGVLSCAIMAAVLFYGFTATTLSRRATKRVGLWKTRQEFNWPSAIFCMFGIGLLCYLLSYGAIEGNRPQNDVSSKLSQLYKDAKGEGLTGKLNSFVDDLCQEVPKGSFFEKLKVIVPCAFELFGYVPFATIDFEVFSIRGLKASAQKKLPDETSPQAAAGSRSSVSGHPKDAAELCSSKMDVDDCLASLRGRGANLKGKDLRFAYAVGASFAFANLKRARLQHMDLSFANLQSANLSESDLSKASLQYANLENADLTGATLISAKLLKANLTRAVLSATEQGRSATLACADLSESWLEGALLTHAILQNANLHRAKLRGANLLYADLKGADLSKADLSGVLLEQEQIDLACGDAAILPKGMKQPKPCPKPFDKNCTDQSG